MVYRRRTYNSRRKITPRYRNIRRRAIRRRRPRRYGYRHARLYNVAPSGMPRTRIARLRYVQKLTLNVRLNMVDTFAYAIFNANGPYKPDGPVSNAVHQDPHQPMGYDQWSDLFNNYVVKGSKLTAIWYASSAQSDGTATPPDQSGGGRIGVYVTDSRNVAYTEGTSFKEARKGQVRYINTNQRTAKYLNAYYSPRRVYGIRDIKDNQARLGSVITQNPAELAQYVVWAELDNYFSGENVQWLVEVTIEYLVQFDEPADLPQSIENTTALRQPRPRRVRRDD